MCDISTISSGLNSAIEQDLTLTPGGHAQNTGVRTTAVNWNYSKAVRCSLSSQIIVKKKKNRSWLQMWTPRLTISLGLLCTSEFRSVWKVFVLFPPQYSPVLYVHDTMYIYGICTATAWTPALKCLLVTPYNVPATIYRSTNPNPQAIFRPLFVAYGEVNLPV